MYKGSCLCKSVQFNVNQHSNFVSHCHCTMCQKQHGAAFATYINLPRNAIHYLCGEDQLTTYNSSEHVLRKFCTRCGSNVEWVCERQAPGYVAIALAIFDSPLEVDPQRITLLHEDTKVSWGVLR